MKISFEDKTIDAAAKRLMNASKWLKMQLPHVKHRSHIRPIDQKWETTFEVSCTDGDAILFLLSN